MELYLIISIDTECDKGPEWVTRRPLSFNNIYEGVPNKLQPLFHNCNIKPTYLLSPEVIENDSAVSIFRGLGEAAELGTHLHSEFIEPQSKPNAHKTLDFQNEYSPLIEYEKLSNLTELFERKVGYMPKSFRSGRFGIGKYTLSFLEDLGYLVDSSITPYKWWWRRKAEGVNFLGSDNQPYYPSYTDFRKPGNMKILEVPVTCINPFWDHFPKSLQLALKPLNRYQAIILNTFFKKHLKPKWLRPTYSTGDEMLQIVETIHKKIKNDKIVLCMMFHSNEATPCMSPYAQNETEVQRSIERIRLFLEKTKSRYNVHSIGLSEACNII